MIYVEVPNSANLVLSSLPNYTLPSSSPTPLLFVAFPSFLHPTFPLTPIDPYHDHTCFQTFSECVTRLTPPCLVFPQEKRLIPKSGSPTKDPSAGLWVQCESCQAMLYVKILKQNKRICDQCGSHLPMSSTERIDLLIDPGSWAPLDENMMSLDTLGFIDEENYCDRLIEYQNRTGMTDAVQTGTGKLYGVPVALGVMDFQFMGGSMGSVVGEKLTRLIEHAIHLKLPLIIVCASGGARMQEGTLSLMQMAKISSALHIHQTKMGLLYIAVLTSPTTGGVTASFGMLGDLILAEPESYIAFAGKRVIEQTLNQEVPEGFQSAESLFKHGLLDMIVPRPIMKGVLGELLQLYSLAPKRRKEAAIPYPVISH